MHVPNPWLTQPPPLENGDRLTRAEFHRRYAAMPDLKKAELIEGVVYMPSPVRLAAHGEPHRSLNGWLFVYSAATPGVRGGNDTTVLLDGDNEPQPDGVLFVRPEYGGNVVITADDFVERAPELVAEVSASSASIDVGPKLEMYRRNGAREYLVWRVLDGAIDWYALRGGAYHPLPADAAGVIRSEAFPGLWLDCEAIARGELPAVLATLQRGLATPEHAAFVAGLAARKR